MFLAGSTQDARDCCDGRVCAGAWRQKPRIVSGNELLPLRLRADMRRRGMERVRKGGGGAACLAMVSVTLPAAKRRLRCCRRRGAVCGDAFATRFSAHMFHVKHLFLYRTTLRQCVSRETCAGKAVRQGFDDRSGDCLAAARSRRGSASGYSERECTISPSGCARRRGTQAGASRGSARPRRRAVRSTRERAVACAQVLHVGGRAHATRRCAVSRCRRGRS